MLIDQIMISDDIVNDVTKVFDEVKHKPENVYDGKNCTRYGLQTKNIIQLEDFQPLKESLLKIKSSIEQQLNTPLQYYAAHFIEYETGGYQALHDHGRNNQEDISYILYLSDSVWTQEKLKPRPPDAEQLQLDINSDGQTYFEMENFDDRRLSYQIHTFPQVGKLVFFESSIMHGAHETRNMKKVLVGGLKFVDT